MPHSATLALPALALLRMLLGPAPAMADSPQALTESYIAGTFRAMLETALEAPTDQQAAAALRPLLQRDFAIDETARFVLGRYWPANNPPAGTRFQEEFGDFAADALAAALRAHPDLTLTIRRSRNTGEDSLVESDLAFGSAEPVPVTWYVHQDGATGARRIVDFSLAGIDARIMLRTLAAGALERDSGNFAGLIALLRQVAGRAATERPTKNTAAELTAAP
jgi:phospholipid transport system substrate-binding protein